MYVIVPINNFFKKLTGKEYIPCISDTGVQQENVQQRPRLLPVAALHLLRFFKIKYMNIGQNFIGFRYKWIPL